MKLPRILLVAVTMIAMVRSLFTENWVALIWQINALILGLALIRAQS